MSHEKSSLLLVEDHESTRRALTALLGRKGWNVLAATTVAEGLALLEAGPDCIILDLMLPDGPGEAILREVRQRGLRSRVVVCTGLAQSARLEEVHALGPAAVLQKPVDLPMLLRACGHPAHGPLAARQPERGGGL